MAKHAKNSKSVAVGVPSRPATQLKSAPPLPSWMREEWALGLYLILAIFLVYQPISFAKFIWDDDIMITANPAMNSWAGLLRFWTTREADICPLTLTVFWFEHAVWGDHALPYHFVTLCFHAATALTLWRVLLALRIPAAWLGAALWAVHPVMVESVAWIAEMKNTQSGLFFLLAILFFLKGLPEEKNGRNHSLTILFAALAMLSKSSTVVLPIILILCAWWMEGRWPWHRRRRLAPIFLMSLAAGFLSLWTQGLQLAEMPDYSPDRPWLVRLVIAGDSFWFYLGKLAWPNPLLTVYPRWQVDTASPLSYLPLATVVLLSGVFWIGRRTWSRPWFFAFACFLVAILPVLGFANNTYFRYAYVTDHFQYLAAMPPLVLCSAGLTRIFLALVPTERLLSPILGGTWAVCLGLWSWQQCWVYETQETLWAPTLALNPGCWVAHNNLANIALQKHDFDEAIMHYQAAIQSNPRYAESYDNYGSALALAGKIDEAITLFRKALEIRPTLTDAQVNLGTALSMKGDVDGAIAMYRKALQISPDSLSAHHDLGLMLVRKGQNVEAKVEYLAAIRADPRYAQPYVNLGLLLIQEGNMAEAEQRFQQAVNLDPTNLEAHLNLGNVLVQKGDIDHALPHYQKILEIDPQNTPARVNLGRIFASTGNFEGAIEQFQAALQIDPSDKTTRDLLARAKAELQARQPTK